MPLVYFDIFHAAGADVRAFVLEASNYKRTICNHLPDNIRCRQAPDIARRRQWRHIHKRRRQRERAGDVMLGSVRLADGRCRHIKSDIPQYCTLFALAKAAPAQKHCRFTLVFIRIFSFQATARTMWTAVMSTTT